MSAARDLGCLLLLAAFSSGPLAHAQGLTEGDFRLWAGQLRQSTFVDGALLADPKGPINYGGATPRALSTSSIGASFSPRRWPGLQVEVYGTQETRISGTSGSVAAVAQFNGSRPALAGPAQLPFSVTSQSMRQFGLGLSMGLPKGLLGDADIRVGGRAFSVDQFRSVDAAGTLTIAAAGDRGLQAEVDERKLGGDSLYIHPSRTVGVGVSASASVAWGALQDSHLNLKISDVGPGVRIDHVLQTHSSINSSRVSYDADGHIQFAPIMSGRNADVSWSAKQYAHFEAEAAYRVSPAWLLLTQYESSYPIHELALGLQWGGADSQLRALIHGAGALPASLEMAWQMPSFSLAWKGDALSPRQARVWGLSGQWRF